MRTYGLMESFYRQAREVGVTFLRFDPERPPELRADGSLQVIVHDEMLDADVGLEADRVVLSVAVVPRDDADELAKLLKVPRTADGFFQEAHLKLRPVDFASDPTSTKRNVMAVLIVSIPVRSKPSLWWNIRTKRGKPRNALSSMKQFAKAAEPVRRPARKVRSLSGISNWIPCAL
jgi:hypothetical protein